MSTKVLYSSSVQKIVDDVRTVDEEYIIRGDKGLKIKFYKVRGIAVEKIVITGNNGKYMIKKTTDKDKQSKAVELTSKQLVAELKSSKFAFAKEFVKDLMTGGRK